LPGWLRNWKTAYGLLIYYRGLLSLRPNFTGQKKGMMIRVRCRACRRKAIFLGAAKNIAGENFLKRINIDGQHVVVTTETLDEMCQWLEDNGKGLTRQMDQVLPADDILAAIGHWYPGGVVAFLGRD
jgi:hypothetical protein